MTTYERGPGGGAGLFAAFAIGVGAGALGLFAFLEWQKTQPTAGLRGDTTMGRTYLDVVGSQVPSHTVREPVPGPYVVVF